MDEKLEKVRAYLATARSEMTAPLEPDLWSSIDNLILANEWLLSAVEQLLDRQADR